MSIKIRVRESAHKKFESRRPARESRSITMVSEQKAHDL